MSDGNSTTEYRDVPGFPGYRVGDDGSVWRRWVTCRTGRKLSDKWRPMKLGAGSHGYLRVNLVPPEGGSYQTFRVHILVLLAFVGPRSEGEQTRHLNGIRTDNRLVNLTWGTITENVEDRRKHANHGPNICLYTRDGRTMPLKDWAAELGIEYNCLWQRINSLGMSFEEAISRPYRGTASNGGHWTKLKKQKPS